MQQRVGLARALALDPPILLMDEAFSALDPLIRRDMQDLLLDLQAEQRRTVVFISHDLDEAIRIGDRIALMQSGEVLQCGTPQELLEAPANPAVRAFFQTVDRGSVLTLRQIVEPIPEDLGITLSLDSEGRFQGLRNPENSWIEASAAGALPSELLLNEAISAVSSNPWPTPVLDPERRPLGVVTPRGLLQALKEQG
jgi:glycine betaine/proline transport system ATP-binding protein